MKLFKEIACSLAFWAIYFLAWPLFYVICFAIVAIVAVMWWIFVYPLDIAVNAVSSRWIHHSNWDHTEQKFIGEMFPPGTTSQTITVFVPFPYKSNQFVNCKLNVVISTAESEKASYSPYLVVFHGVGSSATLMLSTTISSLTKYFNVISVDVPGINLIYKWSLKSRNKLLGLGRSLTEEMSIEELTADECLSFFRAFYRSLFGGYVDKIIETHRLAQSRFTRQAHKPCHVFILGHSLGGYLSIMSLFDWENGATAPVPLPDNCTTRDSSGVPTHISGLILASPAGILPSLSPEGAYWGVLFYFGIPMSILRCMGSTLASLLVIPWMKIGELLLHELEQMF